MSGPSDEQIRAGYAIFTVRDGKIAKVEAFTDRERAFAAAGIS